MRRSVELLEIQAGRSVLALLPRLTAALDGGPALLAVPSAKASAASGVRAQEGVPSTLDAVDDDPDDPTAIVMPTSGSTGEAKLALLPVSALRASADATERRLGGPGGWLLTLPVWHIAGLQVLLRAAAASMPVTAMDAGSPFTATGFIDAAEDLAADRRYVSLVPTQLHRILDDAAAAAVLAGFHRVLVGGAATSPSLLARAGAAGIPVLTTYGMSETCGGCVYDGHPLDGMAVNIDVDRTQDEAAGRIALTGPMIARGYLGLPGHPAFPTPGTFVTDDLGRLDGGTLTVLGRADDVIVTGGLKVPPTAVERALSTVPGIGEVLVVGVPDPEWGQQLVALVTGAVPADEQAQMVLAGLPRHYRPRRWLRLVRLPLRGPGKPDRKAATESAIEQLR